VLRSRPEIARIVIPVLGGLLGSCLAWPAFAQNDTDLSAGGLAPPEAIESEGDRQAREQQTEAELTKAEREDSGRGLEFFWLNGEIGATHLGLQTLSGDNLVDDQIETQQTGLVYGGGLGLRLIFITLGARFRMASLPDWQLWTLNAEAGLRIPLGSLEPYFTLGGGYASLAAVDADEVGATGFDVRGGFGLDIYLTEIFSLGGNLTGDVLFLSRPEVGSAAPGTTYAQSGSSIGAAGTLTLVVGLHF
jgi:hypothetical protein